MYKGNVFSMDACIIRVLIVHQCNKDVLAVSVLHVLREHQIHVFTTTLPPVPTFMQSSDVPAVFLIPKTPPPGFVFLLW